jgi:hypothetical protein
MSCQSICFQAKYTADGIKGLEKDKATGRAAALKSAVEALNGKLEAYPDRDFYVIRK